jgi:hypothetical protein
LKKSRRFCFLAIYSFVHLDQLILNYRRILNSLWTLDISGKDLKAQRLRSNSSSLPKDAKRLNPKLILLDYFPLPHWIVINSIAARAIQERTGASIHAFGFVKPFKRTKDLYKSFGISNHLSIKLNIRQTIELWKLYKETVSSIDSPQDVFSIEKDRIKIGIAIYETILRSGKITVDINEIETFKQICRGLIQFVYFRDLFSLNKIEAILVSHDCYIGPGLLDHMAHHFEVPSININPLEVNLPFEPNQLYKRFERYPEYFAALPHKVREDGIQRAKNDLNSRLSGKIGIKMGYQEESAFAFTSLPKQLIKSTRLKVLIATHDFYDNPHAYGGMLFNDFYIWLEFLNKVANETTYDWYLKCHKDASVDQKREVEAFSRRNIKFKMLDSSVSFHQLADEGLDFVLTCYGSVGHELPLLGVNVLNSSYNPQIAYNFNHHARSIDEYKAMLMNLSELKMRDIPTDEIYEFFYVHHYLMWPDGFIFPSYEDYLKHNDYKLSVDHDLEYINRNYEHIENNVRLRLKDSLKSRRVFSVERILDDSIQNRYPVSQRNVDLFNSFKD